MIKTTVQVEGMACGMCEAHVNNAIRNAFSVQKVTSSHSKGKTEILSEGPLDESALRAAIESGGYKVLGVSTESPAKKGFSLFRK